MKKLCFLSMFFLLVGCAFTNNVVHDKNPNCTGVKVLKVFQVVDGGALATTVAADSIIVYLPNSDKYTLFDGAKIQRQYGECIVYDGVYKYTTSGDDNGIVKYSDTKNQTALIEFTSKQKEKTVPIVKFEKRWLD